LDEINISKIGKKNYCYNFFKYLKKSKKIVVKYVLKKDDKEKGIRYFQNNLKNIKKLKIK
jgi:hypothetical protein